LPEAIILQRPGQRAAFGVRGTGDSPITAVVTAGAVAGPHMIKVIVVDSRVSTNVSSSPTLTGESEADSPAETAGRHKFLYYRRARAGRFCLTRSWT